MKAKPITVVCTENPNWAEYLTAGKEYQIIDQDSDRYQLKADDLGNSFHYSKSYFGVVIEAETKTILIHNVPTVLTVETIKATRKWFADNAQGCIDEVLSGEVKVNNQNDYISVKLKDKANYLTGDFKMSLTFWQRAAYIQTEICVGILG